MKVRNENIDSIKGFLIILVVFCHLAEPLLKSNVMLNRLYDFIYIFHMPTFIFICGYVQKKIPINYQSLVIKIIIPLVVFSLLYEIPEIILAGTISGYLKSGAPNWVMWFLVSLLCWRILTPLFLTTRYPIVVSLLVSILVSCMDFNGYAFSISRTFVFLPFYILGIIIANNNIKIGRVSLFYLLQSLIAMFFIFYFIPSIDKGILYGATPFSGLGLSDVDGIKTRIYYYILSSLTILCSLLIGAKITILSKIGSASLHVYLWHGLIVKFILWRYLEYLGGSHEIQIISSLIIAVILSFILSNSVIVRINNFIFDNFARLILTRL
ncbi:Fucose 4-O-acetylase and related acetyltransferases [Pragia fontium]|uniref:acyltransferase family protein n=1 Tax=Pragia fontium TaxID=82985 RepID=UPI000DFF70D6|nr:acyltransferase family protein [Pragia fontium]SUB82049.1 Fucose 4-O-acetylase and related acetyltransferases [Pragia fontium]